MNYCYPKAERLKSKKIIDALFIKGDSVKSFPLRLVYLKTELPVEKISIQAGVSVSKRNFKLAVSRNRIKRLMRESYRLHRNLIDTRESAFALLFLYTGREEISQQELHKAMIKIIDKFNEAVKKETPNFI